MFFGAGITPTYVAAADLNHDGKIDLALAGAGYRHRACQIEHRNISDRAATGGCGYAGGDLGGVTRTSTITVLKPLDTFCRSRRPRTLYGALIGTLQNAGGDKYVATFTAPAAVLSVTLKSSLGGTATIPVVQK